MLRTRLGLEPLEDRSLPSATQFVDALYTAFLNRTPSTSEAAGFINALNGGASPASVAALFPTSNEFINLETQHDYQTLLGRPASAAEQATWLAARQAGMTEQQEQALILVSDEFFGDQGGTAQGWITGIYQKLLGRTPSAAEVNGWLSAPVQTAAERLATATTFVTGPEADGDLVDQAYQLLLHRTAGTAEQAGWVSALEAGLPVSQLLGDIATSTEFFTLNNIGPITAGSPLLTLDLNPLDINLLGLEVQTNAIQVTVSAQSGPGELLGNALTDASNLLNLPGVSNALDNVLGSVVSLLNSSTLNVAGVGSGAFDTANVATVPVLDLFVAPVHLNLLGALVDTSPIHLTITAHSGPGLVLGNVVADLANLFNPPLPSTLTLDQVNSALENLLSELNAQIPNIGSAPVTTPTTSNGTDQVLALSVPPIDVNLLGLVLQTSQIQVNADAITGNGDLLGNVLTTLLNTLGATPQNLNTLNTDLNALLAKVVGVLNASTLTLPVNALSTLDQTLQTLALPDLINTSGAPASAPILNLAIASSDGSTPPVDVNLLGLQITTSNIQAQLLAQTGNGEVLGNLLYNVANLLNPGGSLSLLAILNTLGL